VSSGGRVEEPKPTTNNATTTTRRWTTKRVLGAVFSLVLIVAVFGFLLPKLADYRDIFSDLDDLSSSAWIALAIVGVWNLFALTPLVVVSLPGVRFREAFVDLTAGTAVANTVPAGSAIGVAVNWAMFDSWGFIPAEYTLSTLVSGLWNNFVKLGLPVVALVLLAASGDVRGSFVPAAIIGVIVLAGTVVIVALLLSSDRLAVAIGDIVGAIAQRVGKRFGRTIDRNEWGREAVSFRHRSIHLIRARWPALTVTALIGHLSLLLVLLVAVHAVGISNADVSWQQVVASFAFVRLISAIPITPGGLGVVELGLTAALSSGASSTVAAQAATAVLIYRALTYLLPIPIGAACYVFWRINRSWRRTPEQRRGRTAPTATPAPGG
jgi:putative heme transporter